jgi:hypothetical protein
MMSKAWILPVLLAGVLFASEDPALQMLETQVKDYLSFRSKVTEDLPKLKAKAEPEDIQAHRQALADAVRSARSGAKQGDILKPEIAAYLRKVVRGEMKGPEGKPAREAAKQGNPRFDEATKPVPVRVNAIYPDSAPASTVPATLLLQLPKLPKGIDFRFVGRHLVLRDIDAGLIIDFIPDVMP